MSLDTDIVKFRSDSNSLDTAKTEYQTAESSLRESRKKVKESLARELVDRFSELPVWFVTSGVNVVLDDATLEEALQRVSITNNAHTKRIGIRLEELLTLAVEPKSTIVNFLTRSDPKTIMPEGLEVEGKLGASFLTDTGEPVITTHFDGTGDCKVYFRGKVYDLERSNGASGYRWYRYPEVGEGIETVSEVDFNNAILRLIVSASRVS